MTRFLWTGVGEKTHDHLVSWDVCCKSKISGRLDIVNFG